VSAGLQCDTCRAFAQGGTPGWLFVAQQPEPSATFSFASMFGQPAEPLTFCTFRCLAEWAYVRAVALGPATGKEPG